MAFVFWGLYGLATGSNGADGNDNLHHELRVVARGAAPKKRTRSRIDERRPIPLRPVVVRRANQVVLLVFFGHAHEREVAPARTADPHLTLCRKDRGRRTDV